MHVTYIVSRFPHPSETFIVRELDALEATGGMAIDVLALFPPVDATVHPAAEHWLARLERPSALDGAAGLGWWALRRPLRLLAIAGLVLRCHLRRPRVLVRALATLPLAAAHARAVLGSGSEHVHAHYATYPALSAWVCHRLTGTPYSVTAHAHDIFVDQSMLRRKLADAAFVVTISEHNRGFLSAYVPVERVHVVHTGVDPGVYGFSPRSVPAEGRVRALCVASLQEYKGHAVLLEALAGGPELERVELDLVGGGPLRPELERRAAALGIGGRVRFHGTATEDEVRELLAGADLFVLPSLVARNGQMEGLPVVLIEALAAGLPVVSTRLSGIPELVEEGRTGLLAAPGDARSLREALERVVSGSFEPDLAAGRELVERSFDVSAGAARMRQLFDSAGRSGAA